ncbi:MAG TPA: tRNA 2-thiouridine(34) synthase MnmA [Candidatus Saccharimonadales bacterium]|nr:tRNA 2-thiouridine(34) synthase MnmA [Candidatus Saccharimonadales bacterium]
MSDRVFVAMSGGVDSSLAAALLVERGEDVVGVWMRLTAETAGDAPRCCGTDEAGEQARRAAAHLGIPFYALDYAEVFGREVVDRFVSAYASGETPNPCVACNQYVKFEALLGDVVHKFGATRLATGHYARVDTAPDGRRRLLRARDAAKDQSYALYGLGQRELRALELPIGELADKAATRRLAAAAGLPNAMAPDSMDICFIGGDYRDFVRERAPGAFIPGPIERADGTVVGTHAGVGALTVGQRQGVGVATGERLYVLRLEPDRRAAIVGTRSEISAASHLLRDVSFTAGVAPAAVFDAQVRLRYGGTALGCTVTVTGDGLRVDLREPALVAPGQAAVLYDGDEVLGGGVVRMAA